jgi:hypothetical protein
MGYMTDGIVYIITTNYGMNHELVTCLHIASLILTLRANFWYLDKRHTMALSQPCMQP